MDLSETFAKPASASGLLTELAAATAGLPPSAPDVYGVGDGLNTLESDVAKLLGHAAGLCP